MCPLLPSHSKPALQPGRILWLPILLVLLAGIFLMGPPRSASAQSGSPGNGPATASPDSLAASTKMIFLPVLFSAGQGGTPPGCANTITVSDPLYQTGEPNMRQIHADAAWANCLQGSPDMIVAVVDGGVDLTHPDLAANLLPGYNFVANNTDPSDDNGHGTHVAGIIAASLNGAGVVGVAPRVKILPVKVMSGDSGYTSTIAAGIRWAADRAQIINLSLGGPGPSSVLESAVDYAIVTKGRIVVAAAGNDGATGNLAQYPAAYPGVIAVAAVDGNGQHSSFSNSGSYVALSAPGVNILSTFLDGKYKSLSGTSMASPHVAGVAALFWSKFPSYNAGQIFTLLKNTAMDLGDTGWDPLYGYGLVDADPAFGLAAASAPDRSEALAAPETPQEDRSAPIVPGRVLVKYKAAADLHILSVPAGQEWVTVDALRSQPDVEYAEPDYILSASN